MDLLTFFSAKKSLITIFIVMVSCCCFPTSLFAIDCLVGDDTACGVEIKELIEKKSYDLAKTVSEERCWPVGDRKPHEQLDSKLLFDRAESCLYLYSLERFFSNHPRAIEAKEEAKKISSWGCREGISRLCSILGAISETMLEDLLADFASDLDQGYVKFADRNLAIRLISSKGKVISRQFLNDVREGLHRTLQISRGRAVPDCKSCKIGERSTSTKYKIAKYSHFLDTNVVYDGVELALHMSFVSSADGEVVSRKIYSSRNVEYRVKYFGMKKFVNPKLLKDQDLDAYKPSLKTLVGIGISRMPNVSGVGLDHTWHSLQIRAVERFNRRRSEFGFMVDMGVSDRIITQALATSSSLLRDGPENFVPSDRSFQLQEEASDSSESTDIEEESSSATQPSIEVSPFEKVFAVYAIYSHLLTKPFAGYDGVRFGLNIGIGRFFANPIIAPVARAGIDIYFGRRFVIGGSILYRSKSTLELGANVSKTEPQNGSEIMFSLNL